MSNLTANLKSLKLELGEDLIDKWSLNEIISHCVPEEERLQRDKTKSPHFASTSQNKKRKNIKDAAAGTKFVSIHLFNTLDKLLKHASNESAYRVKSSMNTSMQSCSKSEKMLIIQRWNVLGALHNPNGMRVYTKVPNGQLVTSNPSGRLDLDSALGVPT
ncbi:hypothetical protein CR513_01431, partial [Mucuna pruriens]